MSELRKMLNTSPVMLGSSPFATMMMASADFMRSSVCFACILFGELNPGTSYMMALRISLRPVE